MQHHLLPTQIDLRALSPLAPSAQDLADFVRGADDVTLESVSTIWCLLPIVDGELQEEKLRTLLDLLTALDHNVDLVRDVMDLAQRERFAPKFRIFRRMYPRVFHVGMLRGIGQLLGAYLGLRDRGIGRRYDALADLPAHTFGHQLWQFYVQNEMKPAGRFGAYPYEQIGPHDAHHVLAGCDTSYEGEFLVLPFECGSSKCLTADFLVTMMLQAHVGMSLDPSVPPTRGLFDPEMFFSEFARGARVREDLLAQNWDFWAQVDRPIADVRAHLGIDAGGNVDSDHPQWNGKDSPKNLALLESSPRPAG
ncbi:MAG: hypothetical protein V3V08_14155 [Nannocystaceae bacterium]